MQTIDALTELVDYGERCARELYARGEKDLLHVVVGFTQVGDSFVQPLHYRSDEEKAAAVYEAGRHLRELHVVKYVSVSEGWMSDAISAAPGAKMPTGRPSSQPDRKEVLMVIASDGINHVSRIWNVLAKGRKPVLELVNTEPVAGALLNLLNARA